MPPKGSHDVHCWCGNRQKPGRNGQRRRSLQTLRCGMGRSAVFAQHDRPPASMRAPHGEAVWRRIVLPLVCALQHQRSRAHGARPMEHALGPVAWAGDTELLSKPTSATRSGGAGMIVSSSIRITGRWHPARPRWSPLWPGALEAHGVPRHSAVVSTPSPDAPWQRRRCVGSPGEDGPRADIDAIKARSKRSHGSPSAGDRHLSRRCGGQR
jgi:hypothetical protein